MPHIGLSGRGYHEIYPVQRRSVFIKFRAISDWRSGGSYFGKECDVLAYAFFYTYNEDGTLLQEERVYPAPGDNYADTYPYGYLWDLDYRSLY